MLDGNSIVTFEGDPEITEVFDRVAAGIRGAVAVDQVAIQIEGDVVGVDDEAVVGGS